MHHISKPQKICAVAAILLLLAMTVFAALLGTGRTGTAGMNGPRPVAAVFRGLDSDQEYFVGDSFTVPDGEISYGGSKYPAENTVVIFPGGSATQKKTFVLSEGGSYVIRYTATVEGRKISAEESFLVNQESYSFSGAGSSAQYGSHPVYATDRQGLVTKIARGETLYFNQAIDLSELEESDARMVFFATPSTIGVPDATNLRIRFTDAYDSENYVEAELRDVSFVQGDWAINYTYSVAKSSVQPYKGIEGSTIHYNDPFGHPSVFSLSGVPMNGGEPGSENFILKFDYADRQILDADGMIIDLDDATYFTDLWQGFTTGECFISVYAEMYQATHVNLVVTELFGLDLSAEGFADVQKPVITVDTAGMDENALPNARQGTEYRLFPAEAYDVQDGICEVETYVTYSYNGRDINVDVNDGAFVPTRAGEYTIVYRTSDRSGNKAEKKLTITCPDGGQALAVEIVTPNEVAGEAGGEYRVCDAVSYSNAVGNVSVTITARAENGETFEVDHENYTFTPMYSGVYTITVVCEDYIDRVEKTFDVDIGPSDQPQIFDTPELPEYFILGARYSLSELNGYDFTTGRPQEKQASVSVSEDGGDPVPVVAGAYQVRAEKTVRVIYTVTVGENETSVYKDIPVIDVGYGAEMDYAKYFDVTAGSVDKAHNSLDLELSTSTNGSAVQFINALIADGFSFSFNVNSSKNAFSLLNIYLTDSINSEESVLVSFSKGSGGIASASINGGQTYGLTSNFSGTGDNFLVSYDAASSSMRLSASFNVPIDEYYNEKPFEGFSSGKVYLRIEFFGVSGQSAINVFNLNGTSFAEFDSDFFGPNISAEDMRGNRGLGEQIVLKPAMASDVLDPSITFTLRVTGPDGLPVTSAEGVVLDETCDPGVSHTVVLERYGEYKVEYQAVDSSGNMVNEGYGISVVDTVAPTIMLKDGYAVSAKVGDVVTVAEYEAADDYSQTLREYVFIVSPLGNIYRLEGNAFEGVVSGTYTVLITVYDENNNFVMAQYDVEVA